MITNSKPRVLFLNRSYWPDSEATGQLLTQLCEDLASDFDVHVLAGQPNVVEDGVTWTRNGRETRNGVEIHRVRHLQLAKHSTIGRLFNICSFTLSALWWATFCKRPDVVVSETDPFLLPLIALWMKIRHRCHYIAYLQDIYPDIAVAVGKVREGFVTRSLRRSLWFTYRRADRIVVLSEDMQQRCIRNGAPQQQYELIRNWADTESIVPAEGENEFRQRHGLDEAFVVMYSGNHGLAHELMMILDAAAAVQQSDPDIVFAFVGGGVCKADLQQRVADRELTNVRFFPYQPWNELSQSLGAADVHLLSVKPAAMECMSPSKLYGILSAGRPVVAMIDPQSSLAPLIEDEQVGLVCDITQPEGGEKLALILASLAEDRPSVEEMGINARQLAEERFDRRIQTSRFASMLASVLDGPSTARIESVHPTRRPRRRSSTNHELVPMETAVSQGDR